MSSPHIPFARRVASALAAGAALLSAPAAAQTTTHYAGTFGHFESPTWACDAPDGVLSFSIRCDGPGAIGRMSARVDADNALHASSEVTATPAWGNTHWRATSEAFFYDRIEFNAGAAPSHLRFDLRLHGNVSGWMTSGQLYGYGWHSEPVWGIALNNTSGWEEVTGTFIVPVVDNVAFFGLKLITNAQIVPPVGACEVANCAHSIADFSNTASVQQIVAFDDAGNEITGGLQARTRSGVAYALQGGAILSTPEPASLALLGAGAVPLALLGARRRREALARR